MVHGQRDRRRHHAAATDSGAYDLEVHGPGGFFRSFTGNTAAKANP
ncbi:phospholipase domain-containing protein, partial [Streptomyces sp. NPDC058394]